MNFSTWDRAGGRKIKSPSISPAHVIVEFDRTKRQRIFSHKLGNVTFGRVKDLNVDRQRTIDQRIGDITLDGFKYKNIGHVHNADIVVPQTEDGTYSYRVYSHGHPLGGTEHGGMESCSRSGLTCADGEGDDNLCNPGKCIIGTLSRVQGVKWKYESANTFGEDSVPLIYYAAGIDRLELRSVLRGNVETYTENGEAIVGVDKPASVHRVIYLPPQLYFSEHFIDAAIRTLDDRLRDVTNPPKLLLLGVEDRKNLFVSKFMASFYPGTSEGYLNNVLNASVTEEIKIQLLSVFDDLSEVWRVNCSSIIDQEFVVRFAERASALDFISSVYDRVGELFSSVIQSSGSSVKISTLEYSKDLDARPVYSRLPGLSEAYRSDPAFSGTETPAQWLTSGTDEFLSRKKQDIADFYRNFLDPRTCSDATLDWLAQHVGLFGDLWNSAWDRKIKVAMIENAFGWWDRESEIELPGSGTIKTPKGLALQSFPFTESDIWTSVASEDNSISVDWSEIETIKVEPSNRFNITGFDRYSVKVFDTDTSLLLHERTNEIKIDKGKWNGLIEAKGSWIAVAFLSSVFGLKSHTPLELEVLDPDRKILKPKSGLRNAEISAPTLMPYKYDVMQVGTELDAEVGNYTNQLVAGVSASCSVIDSKNVFFRVPYYYNRDGKSWDRTSYIAKNWMPNNLNVRVQYPYLSADLWAVGDGFFEPELE